MNILCRFKHKWNYIRVITLHLSTVNIYLDDKVCQRCGKIQNLGYDRTILSILWENKDGVLTTFNEIAEGIIFPAKRK